MSNVTDSNVTELISSVVQGCDDCNPLITEFSGITTVLVSLIGGAISLLLAWKFSNDIKNMDKDEAARPVTWDLAKKINAGAEAFLVAEYKGLAAFCIVVAILLLVFLDIIQGNGQPWTCISFLVGALLSAGCGWAGMSIATLANVRTTLACAADKSNALNAGLKVAFKSGSVMALSVVSSGLLGVSVMYLILDGINGDEEAATTWSQLAGFAFGASAIALFARVGGGIYTKAADVGADLVGKVEEDMAEDDPNNPATIADNVGDNVGDVAGMGADLFESFVGSLIAAATLGNEQYGRFGVALPFWVAGLGALCSIIGTFTVSAPNATEMAALVADVKNPDQVIEDAMKREKRLVALLHCLRKSLAISSVLVIACSFLSCYICFGATSVGLKLFLTIVIGLVTGVLIGHFTEYATSYTEWPTQSIAEKTTTGPATVIIQGLGIGMLSTVPPVFFLVVAILAAYYLTGVYGIAISAVGMLSTLGITLATDAYGPVADNAGGIAEMAGEEIDDWVRDETDSLDALGNTTAATGKGFAIGSAVLTALALLNAFAQAVPLEEGQVLDLSLLHPVVLPGILIGALLPFVFAALTMLSVGKAAEAIMYECRDQLNERFAAEQAGTSFELSPERCVAISTTASLIEMVPPGTIAVFTPVFVGCLLGVQGLMGLLAGAISSGFLLAVTMANAGGAWDNAKKYVESRGLKKTEQHHAAVVGDTVGDPFKDTSGPALNILIKLMSVVSLVFAPLFKTEPWASDRWWISLIIFVAVSAFLWWFTSKYDSGSAGGKDRTVIDNEAKVRHASQAMTELEKNKSEDN
jgi:H(+)-translocating pyrophosphatase